MTVEATSQGDPDFGVRTGRAAGTLGYAAEVFAAISGAEEFDARSFAGGAPPLRGCAESDREWIALLRDLKLRDERLPALVVQSRGACAMFLVFGRHAGPLGTIRLEVLGARGFRPAQIAATRRFLDEHDAAITHWLVDGAAPEWRRTSVPVTFVIDEHGRAMLAEEPAADDSPLHALYRPCNGRVPPLLAGTLGDLERELNAAPRGTAVTRALPFASVRLARLAGGAAPRFLVTVEPARRRSTVMRATSLYGLSRREGQVLGEALRGSSSTEIGATLSISSSTATFHLKQLLRKTNSRNRTELTARVLGWDPRS
jgi:DNA-binding CsgD family transcriptional regulator